MNFRSAHRRRAWARLSRALRLCVACAALPVMVMAAPGFAACGRPGGRVQAVSVDQRLDIALSDGRTVRLGGLDAPSADRGAPEIANAAQDFLSRRLLGREADLILLAAPTDRWGRTIADLSLPDSAAGSAGSTAAALLAAGLARVRPEFETRGCAAERLVIEDGAMIGSRSMVVNGARVGRDTVLGSGTILTGSIPVIDAETGEELSRGHVPDRCVAVGASRRRAYAGGEFFVSCVLVVRRLEEGERHDATVLNEVLRAHGIAT